MANDDKIPVFPATASLAPINVQAGAEGAQFVYFSGTPLKQDVFWQGSIALASKDALADAIAAVQRGEMGSLVSEGHEF